MALTPLTDYQLENWRKMLSTQYGAAGLNMSVADIEKLREKMQKNLGSIPDES